MNRPRQAAGNMFAVGSVLALGLLITLWWRSHKAPILWGYSAFHAHDSLLIQRGTVTFLTPPRTNDREARDLVSHMRNDDLEWYTYPRWYFSPSQSSGLRGVLILPKLRLESPTFELWIASSVRDRGQLRPALLDALDDPNRFLAAHVMLAMLDSPSRSQLYWANNNVHGLRLSLSPQEAAAGQPTLLAPPSVDPAQFSAIRDRWHLMLDARSKPLPVWPATVIAAIVPAVWCRRIFYFLRPRQLGACGKCGYDLRATLERCPECGTVPVKKCL